MAELADVLTTTFGRFMIQAISMRTIGTIREAGQVDVVGLSALWDLRQASAKFPWLVPRFTHSNSIAQSFGRGRATATNRPAPGTANRSDRGDRSWPKLLPKGCRDEE